MSERTHYCSFCGKSQHEVRKLVVGPGNFICSECIDLCHEIVHAPPKAELKPEPDLRFCKDCRWALNTYRTFQQVWLCQHPSAKTVPERDLVTGEVPRPSQEECYRVRSVSRTHQHEWCGPSGDFWEPREDSRGVVVGFGDRCLD